MLDIQRRTLADTGHAHRAVHAKAHGYLKAQFEAPTDLPMLLTQGLFSQPASYDAVLRFSTTPGDMLNDTVSTPRGVALKVLNVPGERLPGNEGQNTRNDVLGNSPSFQVATASGFLKQPRLLAATTGQAAPAKEALSLLSRNVNAALTNVGLKSATLTTLAGQATTELLGDSFFSQGPLQHGDYFPKVVVAPVSDEIVGSSGKSLDLASAYVPVARITATPQETWSDAL